MAKTKPSPKSKRPVAKRRKKPRKTGRPAFKVNIGDLEKLAVLQCTQVEAAAFLGCSEPTLKRRLQQEKYRAVWEAGQGKGRASLRRNLDGFLGGMACLGFLVVHRPERGLRTSTAPVRLRSFTHRVPAWLMLTMIMTATDDMPWLAPNNLPTDV